MDKLAIKSRKTDAGPMIPIDARLTISDDFALDPKKQEQMHKLNEHLKKGETKKAIEVLGPADESVTLTTLFMPLEATSKAIDDASTLLGESKYYEANLALKKAEDGWVSESQSFVEYLAALPKPEKSAMHQNRRNRRMRRSRKIGGCAKIGEMSDCAPSMKFDDG